MNTLQLTQQFRDAATTVSSEDLPDYPIATSGLSGLSTLHRLPLGLEPTNLLFSRANFHLLRIIFLSDIHSIRHYTVIELSPSSTSD